jgi:hypothetical protein
LRRPCDCADTELDDAVCAESDAEAGPGAGGCKLCHEVVLSRGEMLILMQAWIDRAVALGSDRERIGKFNQTGC